MADKSDVKATLNLPRTPFAMKASLAQREPEMIAHWDRLGLYGKVLAKRRGRPPFILHDGPPYANGNIHLGTALNKILKDFIVKTGSMRGFYAPYLPGWDCHGLPIEIHVDKLLGEKKKSISITAIREECRKYAEKYVDIQRDEFRRLGILGEWAKPYLTMDPGYEAEVIRNLAEFFKAGDVYRGKRPVHWCIHCRTALAEAEIEYKDKSSPSIYVKFPLPTDVFKKSGRDEKFKVLLGRNVSVVIWTTTPWTLPANLAIAFHPEYEYVAVEVGDEVFILAKRLLPVVAEELGWRETRTLLTCTGRELENLDARHPFIDRASKLVLAEYVTLEDGTGAVHTAPGHGYDDYLTGIQYGIDIYTPVDDEGRFTPDVPRYAGQDVFAANPKITADMKADGSLLKETTISHSYPHCWRCKNPVIFRATEQWFISMDKNNLRERALEEIGRVHWIPEWGKERISGMVSTRPDWCISRQRSWGVPIPAISCAGKDCHHTLPVDEVAPYVADIFAKEGSSAWFAKSATELLPPGTKCPACGSTSFTKESDILDVWFESGSSFNVLKRQLGLDDWRADVYIEGHDQHRGWFNSSLFVGVGTRNASPYKTCITHGFILDELGTAMSKSLGNAIEPGEVIARSGAEIIRLWAAMLNYKEDARFGKEIEQRLVEAYRKIRNTWRFLLGNLYDFNPDRDAVADDRFLALDRWVLERAEELRRRCLKAYEDYEFHTVFHAVLDFLTVDLSAFYLDVTKDRVYCSAPDSPLRRSAQTAMFFILRDSLLLMAPILSFTADEAWGHLPAHAAKEESVHLGVFPLEDRTWVGPETDLMPEMEKLLEVRERVLKELEKARETKAIGNSLEAKVVVRASGPTHDLLVKHRGLLAELFIVSAVELEAGPGDVEARVERAPGAKCERCWNYSTSVGRSAATPTFCARCADVVKGSRG